MKKTNFIEQFVKLFKLNWKVLALYWSAGILLYLLTLVPYEMLKTGITLFVYFGAIFPLVMLVYLAIDQTRYLNKLLKGDTDESNTK